MTASRPARRRRLAVWSGLCAAIAAALAVIWTAATGVADARHLAALRAQVDPAWVAPGEELIVARRALEQLAHLEAAPRWRHVWLHTLGRASRDETIAALGMAVENAAQVVAARARGHEWLSQLLQQLEQATTIAQAEQVLTAIMAGAPDRAAPMPVGPIADAQQRANALLDRFADDDARNIAAVAEAQAALDTAGQDAAALRKISANALPRPDRRAPMRQRALDAVRAEAEFLRTRLLAQRVQAFEQEAARAPSAAQAAVQLAALNLDLDLRAGAPAGAGVAAARERIEARIAALRDWEQSRRSLERHLRENNPAAAAQDLAALRAPDAERAHELGQLRAGFPSRAAYSLARGVLDRVQREDWAGARRLIAGLRYDAVAFAVLDSTTHDRVARAEAQLNHSEDRALYEALRHAPSVHLAERYLDAWPARPRRMAAPVLEFRASTRRGVGAPPLPPWLAPPPTDPPMAR
ncbi:MAG: hypothetical protein JNK53_00060 [Phycisphaerae bacterium]|nr:hypothetical protein [Phycisphaerae bacterium]